MRGCFVLHAVTLEAVEQSFLDEAMRSISVRSFLVRRAALGYAEQICAEFPHPANLETVNEMRARLKAAHRALFRVVA
jgi:hypothetical protein